MSGGLNQGRGGTPPGNDPVATEADEVAEAAPATGAEARAFLEKALVRGVVSETDHRAILRFLDSGKDRDLRDVPETAFGQYYVVHPDLPVFQPGDGDCSRWVRLLLRTNQRKWLGSWLWRECKQPGFDHAAFAAIFRMLGEAGADDMFLVVLACDLPLWNPSAGKPTPAGDHVLGLDGETLVALFVDGEPYWRQPLQELLARAEPGTLLELFQAGIAPESRLFETLAEEGIARHAPVLRYLVDHHLPEDHKLWAILRFRKEAPEIEPAWTLAILKSFLRKPSEDVMGSHIEGIEELWRTNDPEAWEITEPWLTGRLQDIHGYRRNWIPGWVLDMLVARYPSELPRAVRATLRNESLEARLHAVGVWPKGDEGPEFQAALDALLAAEDSKLALRALNKAQSRNLVPLEPRLWQLFRHKSRPLRLAAARTLARLGPEALADKIPALFQARDAQERLAAVELMVALGTPECLGRLREHLPREENDDVRDEIMRVLERTDGLVLDPAELARRMERALPRIKGPPAAWLDPRTLRLWRAGGGELSAPEVDYLLYRQARCKEIRADLEAKPLFASLDRARCAEAAARVLDQFLASPQEAGDRWALAFAALTGDDRLTPTLHRAILGWAEKNRGKLAEYGTQALALLGTDAALMTVDALSERFAIKNKNIGEAAAAAFGTAAEARNLSVEELADRVVPTLGFPADGPLPFPRDGRALDLRVGPDFKIRVTDPHTGKRLAKLPAGASAATQAEFKQLAASLRDTAKIQVRRMESLLLGQFAWSAERWAGLYPRHPLLRPFALRLVWAFRPPEGGPPSTFRAQEDGALTDCRDQPVTLPAGATVWIAHPLELSAETIAAWLQNLADYGLEPPFAQLTRAAALVPEAERGATLGTRVAGVQLDSLTFLGRATRRGWRPGGMGGAGMVTSYKKTFLAADIDAFVRVEGIQIGPGSADTATLGVFYFMKRNPERSREAWHSEPEEAADPRLLAFGSISPVVYSETAGDLARIAGQTDSTPETSPEEG